MSTTLPLDVRIFRRFPEDKDLVLCFLLVFARFEYALKRTEFLCGDASRAEPDWDRFADSLKGRFEKSHRQSFIDALSYLNDHPPQKQIVLANQLRWKQNVRDISESQEKWILRLVRTVRNNLFHGGKYPYPDGPVEEPARNRHLLSASLTVLEECLQFSPSLEEKFFEAA
jgi:hypothetical protein